MNSKIAEYLEQQIIDNVGETRPYIDPDNIAVMADEIVELFAIPVVSCWLPIPEDVDERFEHYLAACKKNCMIEYYDGSRRRFNENHFYKRAVAYKKE